MLCIEYSNGVYPVDIDELRSLCVSKEAKEMHAHCALMAKTSYFTVKLDNLGELVRYWYLAWKHASKSDMINIVRNKILT